MAAATEFVVRLSAVNITPSQLVDDIIDPNLATKLRGDVILLAESITSDAAEVLVVEMEALAQSCDDSSAANAIVDECRTLLGG